MKNKIEIITFIVAVIIITILVIIAIKKVRLNNSTIVRKNKEKEVLPETLYSEDIEVVATLKDTISSNSAWCGTFQMVWNDMQDEVVKQDIVFQKQIELVENLNEQTFTDKDISEEYYYKAYGLMTLNLKEKIEKGIEEKFNESSDILKKLNWENIPQEDSAYRDMDKKYLFYTMLYRAFNFEKEFSELENSIFSGSQKEYENIEYFGINYESSEELYSQVDVLYYNSEEDFAVILNTKEGDEVILVKGSNGNNFLDIYNNVLEKENKYTGKKYFTEDDTLKVPNLDFSLLKNYEELVANGNPDKMFYNSEGDLCFIEEAVQTIKMSLDKSGGRVKSEAAIVMEETTSIIELQKVEYRFFEFDTEFSIFIREGGKDLPYFAANIDDITLFQ